jgi:hypothetical protein
VEQDADGRGEQAPKGHDVINPANQPDSDDAPAIAQVIFGRFMLPDTSEHPCQVTEVTHEGAHFISATQPGVGIALVAYLEEIGRVEAVTCGDTEKGFHIRYSATGARLERLRGKIDFMLKKHSGDGSELRHHTRYEPTEKRSQITLPDGRVYNCEVLDVSLSGAAIRTEVLPALGTYLMLGRMKGRVVRYIENGVGIQFQKQLENLNFAALTSG